MTTMATGNTARKQPPGKGVPPGTKGGKQNGTLVSIGTATKSIDESANISKWDSTVLRNSQAGNEFKFGTQKSIKTSPDKKLRKHNSSEINNMSSKDQDAHIDKGQKPKETDGKSSKANELSKSVNDGPLLKKKLEGHEREGRN